MDIHTSRYTPEWRDLRKSLLFLLLISCLTWTVSGCKDDDDPVIPNTSLLNEELIISDITNIPQHVTFNNVKATIQGKCWDVVYTIEAQYEKGGITLLLPSKISSEKLHVAYHTDDSECGGFWRTNIPPSNPQALVAGLADIIAYNDDKAVGRIYLTDWSGEGSTAGKAYVYYHYADSPYTLSGSNKSFYYTASFKKGWNAYANIRPSNEEQDGGNHCTTDPKIIEGLQLHWRFESWVY